MTERPEKVVVWDVAVRLVHWSMVILVPLLWWTAEEGHMDWHRSLGLTTLGLVLFRLIWGLLGTWTARFAPMIKRISALPDYVRTLRQRKPGATYGHNPMGVLSVCALLLTLTIQLSTGLFSVDVDGLESGPLAVLVSFDTGRQLAEIHELNFNVLATLILLHISAIATYQFILKDNIIKPMIGGYRSRSDFDAAPRVNKPARPLAIATAAMLSLGAVLIISSYG